ncbi:MAG: ABC transporter permease [Acutalibacteraceae bacterium]
MDYVSPFLLGMGTFKANSESGMCFPVGCAPDMEQISKLSASYGRMFTEEEYEAARNVCIIDGMNAKGLFGYENVVGEYIEVTVGDKTARLRIIGVMDVSAMMGGMDNEAMMEQMSQMTNTMGNMCYVIAPAPVVANLMGSSGRYNMVYLSAKDENQLDAAGNAAKNILQARHNNFDREAYTVTNMATYIELLDKVINVFTTFIAAVSAISLVVGGIGVMNIMYVSVSERTREIGIRKALGARTRTILFQFLTESVILCLIGGIIGMILGISGAGVVSYIMDIPMSVKFSTILISVGFSSAIGIFFGIYPARKAAKMPPIEALRRD